MRDTYRVSAGIDPQRALCMIETETAVIITLWLCKVTLIAHVAQVETKMASWQPLTDFILGKILKSFTSLI